MLQHTRGLLYAESWFIVTRHVLMSCSYLVTRHVLICLHVSTVENNIHKEVLHHPICTYTLLLRIRAIHSIGI